MPVNPAHAIPLTHVPRVPHARTRSVSRDSDNKRWLYGGPGRSWLAVLALAAAMAAPLPLPDLLRSRHAVLWHTALLLRPAASRPLGLRLLDCNAAKLMTGKWRAQGTPARTVQTRTQLPKPTVPFVPCCQDHDASAPYCDVCAPA